MRMFSVKNIIIFGFLALMVFQVGHLILKFFDFYEPLEWQGFQLEHIAFAVFILFVLTAIILKLMFAFAWYFYAKKMDKDILLKDILRAEINPFYIQPVRLPFKLEILFLWVGLICLVFMAVLIAIGKAL